MLMLERTLEQKLARRWLRDDPVSWIEGAFGVRLWSVQREIIEAVLQHKRVAVRSANDVGKSFAMAALALLFLYTRQPCAVITTAPTWNQVAIILWREIHKLWGRKRFISNGDLTQTALKLAPDQFAIGLATNETERFQGFRERNVLFIVDEASGVDGDILEAIEGSLQGEGARLVMVSNPTRLDGPFYDAFYGRAAALYHKMHISAYDYVNYCKQGGRYQPPLVNEQDIEEKRQLWGEGSPLWQIRVLGEFPTEPAGTVIPLHLLEKARNAKLEPTGDKEFGIDIADQGGDETAVCCRQGPVVLWQQAWNTRTTEESYGAIVRLIEQEKPARVKLDYPGVGVGLYAHLQMMKRDRGWRTEIIKIGSGERASSPEEYRLVADELWYELAKRLREGHVDLSHLSDLDYNKLSAQLVSRRGHIDGRGLQYLESKEQLRKRCPSPDRADALAIAFYRGQQRGWSMVDQYLEDT